MRGEADPVYGVKPTLQRMAGVFWRLNLCVGEAQKLRIDRDLREVMPTQGESMARVGARAIGLPQGHGTRDKMARQLYIRSSRRQEAHFNSGFSVRASLPRLLPDGRSNNVAGIGMLCVSVNLPKRWPELILQRMQGWITGDDRASERPFVWMFHQFVTQRIFVDVIADPGKRVVATLILLENMIMRLMLEFLRGEFGFEMSSQEGHGVALVGIQTQSHPNQMQMIRHETIRRTE